jgi:3-hydroxybutyryl-CoA dehydrogenase
MISVLVIGPGVMGIGVAQLAAKHGHKVFLYARNDGAWIAMDRLLAQLDALVTKGKMEFSEREAILSRVQPISSLTEGRDADLVVETIVEDLNTKREVIQRVESVMSPSCVIATNTSSLSITALSKDMSHPKRLVGMHFFNPVPLMKLVEVISGAQTDPAIADRIADLAISWGKTPVRGRSTPGFIVNRIARPFYAEALALIQDNCASPATIDACLRAAGFKMGPCELMDLIGHDINFAVTSSIYSANFYDKRFVPSLIQQELVAGGRLGRKSGAGFYQYPDGRQAPAEMENRIPSKARHVSVCGSLAWFEFVSKALTASGYEVRRMVSDVDCLIVDNINFLIKSYKGKTAYELQRLHGSRNVAVFDESLGNCISSHLAYAVAGEASQEWKAEAPRWLAFLGTNPILVSDTPGLIVARTVAMIINEAADAVLQGVCDIPAADTAMKLGVNYPGGPFQWLNMLGVKSVTSILESLDKFYRGERYRTSPWLQERNY